jgi:hypothetical protein
MAFRRSRVNSALAALVLGLSLPGCIGLFGGDEDQFPASLGILAGLLTGSPPVVPLVPGSPVDLDGDGKTDGTVLDSDGNGVADGVDTNGDGVPEIGLVDTDGDGFPDALDANGDGTPDYWICIENGVRRIKTAPGCSGNNATLIDSNGDGTPDGFDTDGDGTINDGTLAAIAGDSTPPIVSIDIAAGTYGTAQLVRITCADAVAPGTISYTLDGNAPAFSAGGASTLAAPPSTQALVGASGDGAYTLRYSCRDAAGNTAAPQTAAYTIDSNVPSITFQSVASAFVSNAGGIASSNVTWRSNRSGNYSVRHSGANCSSGTQIASGSATANVDVVTNISAATHFAGAGSRAFLFCVTDPGNGLTGSGSQTITRDDTAPTLSLSPGTGNYSSIQSVTASCSDTGGAGCDKIAYSYGAGSNPTDPAINAGTGAVTSGTQYASALTPSDDVVNFYEFRARDNAGNVSSVQAQSLTISTGVANLTVNSFDGTISGGASAFNWQSDRPGSYSVRIGGTDCTNGSAATGTNVSGSIAAATPVSTSITNGNFSGGANTVRLCVQNVLGNYGSTTRTVTKDTTAPTVSIDAPTTAGPHPASTQLTISAADTGGTGVQRIAYTTDGNDPAFSGASCTVTTGTQYTAAVTLANGSYTVKARSCDNAGNVSTVASLALSVGPPSTPTISSATAGNAQVSIAFSAVSGATSYRVYYKTSAGVTTSDSFATGTASPIVASSLTNGTTYYFALAAIHAGGESSLSGESSGTPSATKRIFITQGTWDGNLGGLSGADTKCNADANKPGGGATYKALLPGNGALAASTSYVRADGTTAIGTTSGSGAFTFPLTNSIGTSSVFVWAGTTSTDTCNNWTDASSIDFGGCVGFRGTQGFANNTATNSVQASPQCCSAGVVRSLYCVEQ